MPLSILTTVPEVGVKGADAYFQEVQRLKKAFNGQVTSLYPFRRPGRGVDRTWLGWQALPRLWWLERTCTAHILLNADLYPYPCLRWLRRPIYYQVFAGLPTPLRADWVQAGRKFAAVCVGAEPDARRLQQAGLPNVQVIPACVDETHFRPSPAPTATSPFHLLLGSAPWAVSQFKSKGLLSLLDAVAQKPDLHLTVLWRGLHRDALEAEIAQRQLGTRVHVLDGFVDVGQVMQSVHATVVLAEKAEMVKAFPNSLVESLLCGRPVLLNQAIGMAEWVQDAGVGVVAESVGVADVLAAISRLQASFSSYAREITQLDRTQFFPTHWQTAWESMVDE
ncbi:MAG TPA: glycosyltransferase [Anaerolineales bacterium]|nr:glycosyltransferase [Anaerolineales bacterium]